MNDFILTTSNELLERNRADLRFVANIFSTDEYHPIQKNAFRRSGGIVGTDLVHFTSPFNNSSLFLPFAKYVR